MDPLLNMHNVDEFLSSCMAELAHRTAPPPLPPVSQPVSRTSTVASTPLAVVPPVARQFEPVFAEDLERDAEMVVILEDFVSQEVYGSDVRSVAREPSQEANLLASHVDIDVMDSPPHWVDALDLVTLSPPLSADGSSDVVTVLYELIGPFRLLQIVRQLSPEADVVNAASVVATSKVHATFHSLTNNAGAEYTVE
eukprot:gene14286-18236_t